MLDFLDELDGNELGAIATGGAQGAIPDNQPTIRTAPPQMDPPSQAEVARRLEKLDVIPGSGRARPASRAEDVRALTPAAGPTGTTPLPFLPARFPAQRDSLPPPDSDAAIGVAETQELCERQAPPPGPLTPPPPDGRTEESWYVDQARLHVDPVDKTQELPVQQQASAPPPAGSLMQPPPDGGTGNGLLITTQTRRYSGLPLERKLLLGSTATAAIIAVAAITTVVTGYIKGCLNTELYEREAAVRTMPMPRPADLGTDSADATIQALRQAVLDCYAEANDDGVGVRVKCDPPLNGGSVSNVGFSPVADESGLITTGFKITLDLNGTPFVSDTIVRDAKLQTKGKTVSFGSTPFTEE